MNSKSIGILDTGVGGLSVWREIQALLPEESTIYLADSLYCPYGNRTNEEIFVLSRRLIQFLLSKDVKSIVIACNTITVAALDKLRREFSEIPIIGTIPVVKTAVALSKNGKIGILSTRATAKSAYQKKLISLFAQGKEVLNIGTDRLVPLVEKGFVRGEKVTKILQKELASFKKRDVDVIALGCTHYPFLKSSMQQVLGDKVSLLDSGPAIARQLERVLSANDIKTIGEKRQHSMYTTGDVGTFQHVVRTLIGDISANYQGISLS